MKNKSKVGITFENALKNHFEKQGYFVIRSAGSKSPADIVVISNDKLIFVQCKATKSDKPFPKSIASGKTYKDFEQLNANAYKLIAFYNFKNNMCAIFIYDNTNKSWEYSYVITGLIPK